MNLLQQLENAPKNIVLYVLGLVGAVVDDYALLTLTIFVVLLGFVLGSVLIPAAVFFGAYFVMRMVMSVTQVLSNQAEAILRQAQATMQVATALYQANPNQAQGVQEDTSAT